MKITRAASGKRSRANTLFVVLFTTAILGLTLASYLMLVRYQNLSVMRSLAWNTCIPIVEAGIEEAMTHIDRSGLTNLFAADWQFANNCYTKTRYLGDSYYVVSISTDDPPVVMCEGHVPIPLSGAAPLGWLAAVGLDSQPAVRYAVRRVRVTTQRDPMWSHAMAAEGDIDLLGNNIQTDSFDSCSSSASTGGGYDLTKRRDHGDVATNSTITNSLSVGNADLWGHASTGPGGSVDYLHGSVGDLNWHLAGRTGIEPGWTNNDMNVYFRPVKRPFSGNAFTPQSGTVAGVQYSYVLGNGSSPTTYTDYMMSDLRLQGNNVMLITNKVRLLVTGSIDIQGNGMIQICPGSSLELYMEGANASIGGNGVANQTGYAINFIYFGLPTNTSISFSGNAAFIGAIYAPKAGFTLGGGGNNTLDFIGSSVSNTIRMNGHFHFHYDECLGRSNWARGYIVNGWNEI